MYEVEVKVRADHAEVQAALEGIGSTSGGVVAQVDTYYDPPHRDFAQTDEALRLRQEQRITEERGDPAEIIESAIPEDGAGQLTYKGPLVEAASKTREEVESPVGTVVAVASILDHLGFGVAGTVRKLRRRYEVGEYDVTLDTVVGLGSFVEVEAQAHESDIEEVRDGARELLETLGLDPTTHVRTSYLELVLEEE